MKPSHSPVEHPALIGFSKATCPTLKSHVLLSPAAATTHTLSIGTPRLLGAKTMVGRVGSGGWFWEVESEPEPRTQIQRGDGGGGGRSAVCAMCVNGGEERRIGTVGWG